MSRKVSKSMKNEKTDLQKHIGCITGLFQLFDRHRFLAGGSNDQIRELGTTMPKAKAKNLKAAKERQQFSTESSISSLSTSSCSSSMSSVDFSRTVQVEAPSIPHIKIPGITTSGGAALKQLETAGRQSHVKDSKHREAQGLTVKTVAKEGKKGGHTLKYIDSPRPEPFQASKSVNAGVMAAKEPLHILPKSQKAPWDSPRLSYDERVTQDTFKSTARHKELPRLSLDSRAGSMRSLSEGTKSRNLLKGPQKGYGSCSTMVNQLQEPETSRRQSSVVAKLMGLDAFPDCTQTCETMETWSCPANKKEHLSRDSTTDERKHHQSHGSPRICKGPTLLQHARTDSTMNGTSYLPFLQEPTQWRQPDTSQGSQCLDSKDTESAMKVSNSSNSVYAEVEKRLAELEFKKSGKDLRALKQILEAMQRYNHSLDISRDLASSCPSDTMSTSSLSESSKVQSPRNRHKAPKSISTNRSNSPHESKLPIVIMKPARNKRISASPDMQIHGKSGPSEFLPCNPRSRRLVDRQKDKSITAKVRHLKDLSSQLPHSADKNDKISTSKLMENIRVPRHINGENISSGNKTETESPRLHKKFGWERRSLPTTSCSSSDRKQHNRRSLEISSPSTTPRSNSLTSHEANERFSKAISPRKDLKDTVDIISPDFYTNKRLITHRTIRVIHANQSEISRTSFLLNDLNRNKAANGLSNESSLSETTIITEQPSPISVLDAAFYRDDPPSPIKKKSDISKYSDAAQNADDEKEENSIDLTSMTNYNFSNWDGDLNTQYLVQKLQKTDSRHDKAIDFIGPLSDSEDPDHKYISEILFASGLLSGQGSSQTIQSSPQLNGTKLFLALEQIQTKKRLCDIEDNAKTKEQLQRKLVLDVVYDILVQKLILESSPRQRFLPHELVSRKLRGQQLVCEIFSEFDKLRHENKNASLTSEDENLTSLLWGDLKHQPKIWTSSSSEIPGIVLDVERLIFKDLITEVVRGEVANHPGKHCRQLLFPK